MLSEPKQRVRRVLPSVRHDAVAGRVRFSHPGLRARPRLVKPIVNALRAKSGVHSVKASAATGSILVGFSSPATRTKLAHLIANAAARKPVERARPDPPPTPIRAAWHARSSAEVLKELCPDRKRGLSEADAVRLLARFGPNALARAEARSSWAIFAEQLSNLPMALLGASAGISLLTGGLAAAAAILAGMLA